MGKGGSLSFPDGGPAKKEARPHSDICPSPKPGRRRLAPSPATVERSFPSKAGSHAGKSGSPPAAPISDLPSEPYGVGEGGTRLTAGPAHLTKAALLRRRGFLGSASGEQGEEEEQQRPTQAARRHQRHVASPAAKASLG